MKQEAAEWGEKLHLSPFATIPFAEGDITVYFCETNFSWEGLKLVLFAGSQVG